MSSAFLHQSGEDVVIDLLVQPRAGRTAIAGRQGEELKVRLAAPPVEGAANRLCCEYFAGLLGVAKGRVRLAAGERSRHKRLLVREARVEDVRDLLLPHLPEGDDAPFEPEE